MKLSKTQLSKLSPAERKARAKRLAYNRAYDQKKKLMHVSRNTNKMLSSRRFKKAVIAANKHADKLVKEKSDPFARLETLIRELRDLKSKQISIIEEIKSIQL